MSKTPTTYNFHTIHEGVKRAYPVLGYSISDAVATLRAGLYDGETIVGWAGHATSNDVAASGMAMPEAPGIVGGWLAIKA
jgi:hypothetical protein